MHMFTKNDHHWPISDLYLSPSLFCDIYLLRSKDARAVAGIRVIRHSLCAVLIYYKHRFTPYKDSPGVVITVKLIVV